jgi:hypothetical protein
MYFIVFFNKFDYYEEGKSLNTYRSHIFFLYIPEEKRDCQHPNQTCRTLTQPLREDTIYFFPIPMKGIFYICISQAIDPEIQHGNNHGVKYGSHFISVKE